MTAFAPIHSHVVPLLKDDVDTDQIIPARFLKVTDKANLGDKLFCDWRYDAAGQPDPAFALNDAESRGAQVLLAGRNFGSGSSREHAPWALVSWGLRAVLARSFADIFRNNALKNGLLPIALDDVTHAALVQTVQADRGAQVHIDLAESRLTLPDGSTCDFTIDAFAKHCLLSGIDELGYLRGFAGAIAAFEDKRPAYVAVSQG
ncbi:MAG: 3-isopropylmalate dehydratase small subunit [Polyangiales bacterium]